MCDGEDEDDEVGIGDGDGARSGGEIASKLKECDISTDNILVLIWKINLVAFLHVRVADEHPFE